MYQIDILIQGYPGRAVCHGGLGWSTSTLLRSDRHKILVDVGAFGVRHLLGRHLDACGVAPADITDVVLTHAHYDHAVNFTLFPNATVWIGAQELQWAAAQPPGFNPLPELYVRELDRLDRVRRIGDGDAFLPGITAIAAPGHTPGICCSTSMTRASPSSSPAMRPRIAPNWSRARWSTPPTPPPAMPAWNASGSGGASGPARCWCRAMTWA
ncbi:MBL fold metallo-hydrolase [Achromobacter xylosoxidans]